MNEAEQGGSFVARIWLEGSPGQTATWRGHVRHVQGEEESYFQSMSAMQAFLEQVSGVPFPAMGVANEEDDNELDEK